MERRGFVKVRSYTVETVRVDSEYLRVGAWRSRNPIWVYIFGISGIIGAGCCTSPHLDTWPPRSSLADTGLTHLEIEPGPVGPWSLLACLFSPMINSAATNIHNMPTTASKNTP